MREDVYSICFMCTVRCPIKVTVEDGAVKWVEGNSHQLKGALCAKGSAGTALLNDPERIRYPMIREGARGEGKWKRVSWDEALDYTAQKLKGVMEKYGPQTVVFGERQNLNTHISKTFLRAIGSPNHYTHDALCKGSVNTAFRTLTGYTDAEIAVDWANTKHVVLYGRNLFEALELKPIQALMDAKDKGAKVTYIDIRSTVTASHADRFWMIRPGTDLALNYALIHVDPERKSLRRGICSSMGDGPHWSSGPLSNPTRRSGPKKKPEFPPRKSRLLRGKLAETSLRSYSTTGTGGPIISTKSVFGAPSSC
jgi:thiosulfate reductase / polysulfide reductase chain A